MASGASKTILGPDDGDLVRHGQVGGAEPSAGIGQPLQQRCRPDDQAGFQPY
jgi:hypothetical protein